ncbi:glycoside hydrolase N-terminal domain-containing protein [Tessaracoccus sp. OS52]|uniref:glycoside hydrolase N-terminal domain-containing protein n=1 Tax=Tessaracoccus sp. OS52 TaxID=2886691 RepID=UPI001D103037|nr:glycoside hydrolase N-terminal domain-containing protein [Tessaracoccus sp. OS52]MCC2594261.1 glycoside hydrolase N-terminal domain-containing protein [Tessaracoccus sp. OS52]
MTSETYFQRRILPNADAAAGGVLVSTRPATDWPSGAFPIGNGRLGALLSGGVGQDRVQLHEQCGSADAEDPGTRPGSVEGLRALDPGTTGTHRNFGGLLVTFEGVPTPGVRPGGEYQDASCDECIAKSTDDHAGTKWCLSSPPPEVLWIATLPEPQVLKGYSLTSANDAPERDPRRWRFEGSNDGETWETLDQVDLEGPFPRRFMAKTFRIDNDAAYLHYRFVFLTTPGVSHFQVAEVTLPGVDFGVGAPDDYRRVLDPQSGVHTVEYSTGHGMHRREAFASKDADLLVLRYTSDAPEGMCGTINLVNGHGLGNDRDLEHVISEDGSRIELSATMADGSHWAAQARIVASGGSLSRGEGAVCVEGCQALEIRLDLRTERADVEGAKGQPEPRVLADATLDAAQTFTYDELRQQHVASFGAIMSKTAPQWGEAPDALAELSLGERLVRYRDGEEDPDLVALMFQFGRYLRASRSGPAGLPAKLQGLWHGDTPVWVGGHQRRGAVALHVV